MNDEYVGINNTLNIVVLFEAVGTTGELPLRTNCFRLEFTVLKR